MLTMIPCLECGVSFIPTQKSQLFCRKIVSYPCAFCGRSFKTVCSSRRAKNCSISCSKKSAVKSSRRMKKNCFSCGREFIGNSREVYCRVERDFFCDFCGSYIKRDVCNREFLVKSCDSICRMLKNSNSKIEIEKLEEFKDINSWAREFRLKNARKPVKNDVFSYFSVKNLPFSRMDLDLFLFSRKDSFLELIVCSFLEELSISFVRRVRPIIVDPMNSRKNLELDIFLKDFSIAFEVQDFSSHSRESDFELIRSGQYKNGFFKHELKRTLAKEQMGVIVVDLWEDEILSGAYKNKVLEVIS